MALQTLHGQCKAGGIPWTLKGSTRNLVTQLNPPSPASSLCIPPPSSFTMYSTQCISFVIGISCLTKKILQNLKWHNEKVCLFPDGNKLSLSQGYPIQTSLLPTRPPQTILRQTWAGGYESWTSNLILWDKQVILMPLTMLCFIECMSSILSLALTGRAPRHHGFMFCLRYF